MGDKKPHYHGHRERLRKRFMTSGLSGLADYEIVELLLTLALPKRDVREETKSLLQKFGNRLITKGFPTQLSPGPGICKECDIRLYCAPEWASIWLIHNQ